MDTVYNRLTMAAVLSVFWHIGSYAQTGCWNQLNTITTYWQEPQSSNTFDWTQEWADFYVNTGIIGQPPAHIVARMPMWPSEGQAFNPNVVSFQHMPAIEKDFRPEDGWELLFRWFGLPNEGADFPNFALYNRFLGKIRWFILSPYAQEWANGATLSIKFFFGQRLTGLFSSADVQLKPVQIFNSENFLVVPNALNQNYNMWYYGEFQVNYDPCTCYLEDDSKLHFAFSEIQNSTITATIVGQPLGTVSSNATGGAVSAGVTNQSFMDIENYLKSATTGYSKWDGYKGTFNKILDQVDDLWLHELASELKEQPQLLVKFAQNPALYQESADELGISEYLINAGIIDNPEVWDSEQIKEWIEDMIAYGQDETPDVQLHQIKGILAQTDATNKIFKQIKNIAGALPYVGMALGVFEAFVAGGKKSSSTSQSGLTSAGTTFSLDGNITTISPQHSFFYSTPGSVTGGGAPPLHMTYDNILGTVNVMKIPALERKKFSAVKHFEPARGVVQPAISASGMQSLINGKFTNDLDIYQYRLSQPLKYVLNPASGLEVLSVDACYVLDYTGTQSRAYPVITENSVAPVQSLDFFNAGDNVDYVSNEITVNKWKVQGIDLEFMGKGYVLSETPQIPFRLRTRYVPLECFHNKTFALWSFNGLVPKVYIKLVYRLIPAGHVDDLEYKPITIVQTFDMGSNALLVPNSSAHEYNYTYYYTIEQLPFFWQCSGGSLEENGVCYALNIVDEQFNGFADENDLFPDPFIYSAKHFEDTVIEQDLWGHTVVIGDNVLIADGVEIVAANEIRVLGDHQTNPLSDEVIWRIAKTRGTCAASVHELHMTDSEIAAVCSSAPYINSANGRDYVPPQPEKLPNELKVMPNPTSDVLHINVPALPHEAFRLVLMDLTGRLIQVIAENENTTEPYRLQLDVRDLPHAMYLVALQGERTNSVARFVKFTQ